MGPVPVKHCLEAFTFESKAASGLRKRISTTPKEVWRKLTSMDTKCSIINKLHESRVGSNLLCLVVPRL
jgi:hypothetical protein